jgi:hypothetical protein
LITLCEIEAPMVATSVAKSSLAQTAKTSATTQKSASSVPTNQQISQTVASSSQQISDSGYFYSSVTTGAKKGRFYEILF